MISNIKRVLHPPQAAVKFPVYIRTANDRYFIKIKSASEATWLEFVDSEKFKVRATGFDECGPGEFFDIEFMVGFCNTITEKEYISRLKDFITHFEYVKESLNL
jgi:hypothetical protein